MVRKSLIALVTVGVLIAIFTVCLVSASQLLVPREMPFGVTGPLPVVTAVQQKYSLDLITYSSQSELIQAAKRGGLYGGYIPGSSADTLVTVPAKSFFGEIFVRAGFAECRRSTSVGRTRRRRSPRSRPLTARRRGRPAAASTLIGGYLIATMLFSATQVAAAPGRIAIVLAFAVVIALITGITAGPILGAFPTSRFWPLLPCFLSSQRRSGWRRWRSRASPASWARSLSSSSSSCSVAPARAAPVSRSCRPIGSGSVRRCRHDTPSSSTATCATSAGTTSLCRSRFSSRTRSSASRRHPPAGAPPQGRHRGGCRGASSSAGGAGSSRRTSRPGGVRGGARQPVRGQLHELRSRAGRPQLAVRRGGIDITGQGGPGGLVSLKVTNYPDKSAATDAMNRGEIYGALIASGSSNELIVVSSSATCRQVTSPRTSRTRRRSRVRRSR